MPRARASGGKPPRPSAARGHRPYATAAMWLRPHPSLQAISGASDTDGLNRKFARSHDREPKTRSSYSGADRPIPPSGTKTSARRQGLDRPTLSVAHPVKASREILKTLHSAGLVLRDGMVRADVPPLECLRHSRRHGNRGKDVQGRTCCLTRTRAKPRLRPDRCTAPHFDDTHGRIVRWLLAGVLPAVSQAAFPKTLQTHPSGSPTNRATAGYHPRGEF